MPDGSIRSDNTPAARDALRGVLARQNIHDIQKVESELEGMAFAQECERLHTEQLLRNAEEKRRLDAIRVVEERHDRYEHFATEALEVASSLSAGAISTWKTGGVPLGGGTNFVLGLVGKVTNIANPKSRGLRVAARTAKVLLHSQLSIITRNLITGQS